MRVKPLLVAMMLIVAVTVFSQTAVELELLNRVDNNEIHHTEARSSQRTQRKEKVFNLF